MDEEQDAKIESVEEESVDEQPKADTKRDTKPQGQDATTAKEVGELYKDLGIKASVPTGKAKGRPKASSSGNKKAAKQDDASVESEKGREADDSKDQPETPPTSDKDGADGNEADTSSKKDGKKSGQDGKENPEVSEDSDKDEKAVRDSKSKDNQETSEAGEDDAEQGDEGDRESKEGKRPGKSNPEVEKRFQRLTEEKRERDEHIARLERQLQEKERAVQQTQVAQEDPEYTVEDFYKVQDNEGNVVDLDQDEAELAWRRWKDKYDERSSQREQQAQAQAEQAKYEADFNRQVMDRSTQAYDSLESLMNDYPELVSTSGQYDKEFAKVAMPIIEDSIDYLPGTEPGNPEENLPIILGLKINPKQILDAMKRIGDAKRSLPLNGINDNVEARSNVAVPHSRSSDPTVHAANELYKELGIDKRF